MLPPVMRSRSFRLSGIAWTRTSSSPGPGDGIGTSSSFSASRGGPYSVRSPGSHDSPSTRAIRSSASWICASGAVHEKRRKPSPAAPKSTPGVIATCARSSRRRGELARVGAEAARVGEHVERAARRDRDFEAESLQAVAQAALRRAPYASRMAAVVGSPCASAAMPARCAKLATEMNRFCARLCSARVAPGGAIT